MMSFCKALSRYTIPPTSKLFLTLDLIAGNEMKLLASCTASIDYCPLLFQLELNVGDSENLPSTSLLFGTSKYQQ